MTSGWRVAVFAIALACFALAFVVDALKRPRTYPLFIAAGWAFVTLVFLWDAVALDP